MFGNPICIGVKMDKKIRVKCVKCNNWISFNKARLIDDEYYGEKCCAFTHLSKDGKKVLANYA